MNKVAIMTDTITQMPQEIADKYDIKIVPMGIVIDGKLYRENEVNLPEYYQKLLQITETEKLPTSSSISAGEFLEVCRELSQKSDGIVYISHSVRLGASSKAALQAKQRLQEELPNIKIEVIDSGTACGAQMLIALEVARAAAAGKSFSEVVEVANKMIAKVKYIIVADSLEYLASGGRILEGRAWAEAKVSTKALLETDAAKGTVHAPLARYGTKRKAVEGLLEIMKERYRDKKLHVVINHINAPDEAEELKKRVSSELQCVELYVTEMLPVVGRHVGPGSLVLNWWSED
ncbi:MAG: DegV family protein [Dehalococcoidia bacterium]|nr:MAG: DegV family protein [Dehalococcoidia bacterium]